MILVCQKTGRYWRLASGECPNRRARNLGLKDYHTEEDRP